LSAADAATSAAGLAGFNWRAGTRIADRSIWLLVFLGGFVIVEPAPYDLLLVVMILVWSVFGLRLNRFTMPMVTLLVAYVAGGLVGFTQVDDFGTPVSYMLTTTYLVASAVFFAAIIIDDPEKRLTIIRNAYIASAVVAALTGIGGYFGLIPGGEIFQRYGRAMGPFQDPNVFGPFLALPAALLARSILARRLRESMFEIGALLIILLGIFLSFSRAAWGLVVFAMLASAYFAYISEVRRLARFRLVAYLVGGGAAMIMMLAVAISLPSVHALFEERAQVVQSYDESPQGRFERHAIGFFLIQEKPFGIGPLTFSKMLGEDEHNMWLKGFTTYGWLGGFSYIILVIWTLAAAFPLLFKPRPWQPIVQATYAVYLGHVMIHNVIDNDHWRHLYLIYAILWGAIAAEKMLKRNGGRVATRRVGSGLTI
jgi:hypothetical protein